MLKIVDRSENGEGRRGLVNSFLVKVDPFPFLLLDIKIIQFDTSKFDKWIKTLKYFASVIETFWRKF